MFRRIAAVLIPTIAAIAGVAVVGCATGRDSTTSSGSGLPTASADDPTSTSRDDTSPTSATLAVGDATELLEAACAGTLEVSDAGELPDHLSSVSGLAASRVHPDIVWSIEDSLEPAELVALDTSDGHVTEVAAIRVDSGGPFTNLDWEDLAVTVDDSGMSTVYVGDIGDNFEIRNNVRVFRFAEPALTDESVAPEVLVGRYPDGAHNAEALMVDDHGIWIVTKDAARTAVYRLDESTQALELAGVVDLDGEQVSAVDRSPDGHVIAVRTDVALRLYPSEPTTPLLETLAGDPCTTPDPGERQGESVAFTIDGRTVLTVSEDESGGQVELHATRRGPR